MKNINLYLVAFFAILIKTLVFTMGAPEVAAMGLLLVKLSFDSFLATKSVKEDSSPLKSQLQETSNRLIQLENLVKLNNFRKNG